MQSDKRFFRFFALVLMLFVTGCGTSAQETAVIAPGVFIRGMTAETGTVYTVSVVKPEDDIVMRDVHGEIILPAGAHLVELLVPDSINQAYGALNAEGMVGLVWDQVEVARSEPLEPFSFVLDGPVTEELEFYLRWTGEDGQEVVENFFEVPPLNDASEAQETIELSGEGYVAVGNTGVQILAEGRDEPLALEVGVLPSSFNPPESMGAVWWCSIVSIEDLPAGRSVQVVVPLRRPVAPFTALQIVRQSADGGWVVMDAVAIVTADRQYATYVHPGGSIATGGPEDIKPEKVDVGKKAVETAEATAKKGKRPATEFAVIAEISNRDNSPSIEDGTSNTIIVGESAQEPQPPRQSPGDIQDGTSNTIIVGESAQEPQPPQQSPGDIQDGTSNTIIVRESTQEPQPPRQSPGDIQDGTSNTIIVRESTQEPQPPQQSPGDIQDGASNTIIIGEATQESRPPQPRTGNIQDGASSTIIIEESTGEPEAGGQPAPISTTQPMITPPSVDLGHKPILATASAFGQGGARVQIRTTRAGKIVQCQIGGVNCAELRRRSGVRAT